MRVDLAIGDPVGITELTLYSLVSYTQKATNPNHLTTILSIFHLVHTKVSIIWPIRKKLWHKGIFLIRDHDSDIYEATTTQRSAFGNDPAGGTLELPTIHRIICFQRAAAQELGPYLLACRLCVLALGAAIWWPHKCNSTKYAVR